MWARLEVSHLQGGLLDGRSRCQEAKIVAAFARLAPVGGNAAHARGQEAHDIDMARALAASVERPLKGFLQQVIGLNPSMATQRARHSVEPEPGGRRQHFYHPLELRQRQQRSRAPRLHIERLLAIPSMRQPRLTSDRPEEFFAARGRSGKTTLAHGRITKMLANGVGALARTSWGTGMASWGT